MRKENLLGDIERECLENGENVCVTSEETIRKNRWLFEVALKLIKKHIEDECQHEFFRDQNVTVEVKTVDTDVGTFEEEINDH